MNNSKNSFSRMAHKSRFLRLHSITAYLQTENDGDEIFLKYKGEKVAPVDAKFYTLNDAPLTLDVEIALDKADKWAELELWDYDHLSPNDCLGRFKLLVDQASDTFTAELSRKEDSIARYVLNWEIIERVSRKG